MFAGLWLLIFGFIFLLLIFKTVSNLRIYSRTRENVYLKKISIIWLLPASFVFVLSLLSWFLTLTSVDKNNIIGSYEIDTRFYPGRNADWQKEHYRFEVRADDTFILFERLADGSEKMHIGNIAWANEATERWSISMENNHHVVHRHPVLYRERFGFYYVFRTKKFGNMFFRKVNGNGS